MKLEKLLVSVWINGDCPYSDAGLCPGCVLDRIKASTGNATAPPELMLQAFQEILDFRAEALRAGFEISIGFPGMEPTASPRLRDFLAMAAQPHPEIFLSAGDRVSITTNGAELSRRDLQALFRQLPLDILRFSASTGTDQFLYKGLAHTAGSILSNAVYIKSQGGCRKVQMVATFDGSNIKEILQLYELAVGRDVQFMIQEYLRDDFTPQSTEQEVEQLITACVERLTLFRSGEIYIELQPEHYLPIAQLDRMPQSPLVLSNNICTWNGRSTGVVIKSINPSCPYFLGVRADGYILNTGELRTQPKYTEAGICDPSKGNLTNALRGIVAQRQETLNEGIYGRHHA